MKTQVLRFIKGGQVVELPGVDANRTLLEVLREDLGCTDTKEGCGEGDCGACTVVVAQQQGKSLKYSAINSCIRLAHSVANQAVWTAQDLRAPDGGLHPAQQALVDHHGSQCGFCTPGFVMSLFGMYQNANGTALSHEQAIEGLSGNLCRCTGYRPIVQAAQTMHQLPPAPVDESTLRAQLQKLSQTAATDSARSSAGKTRQVPQDAPAYLAPQSLTELLVARSRFPAAQIVAGCTDVGLWITKMHRQFEQILDITQVSELRQIEQYPHHVAIGAAVTLTDAFRALVADRPQLAEFTHRFAGKPVRNSGTLGGNVANGSPIGDSMPLLIALGASIVLMRQQGDHQAHREMSLTQFYIGYRQNRLAADEVLAWIKVPKPTAGEFTRVYKVSKRFEDDISAVCLALRLVVDQGVVQHIAMGAGGVAATPARARKAEAVLLGQAWNAGTVDNAMAVLRDEFSPISDMRASAQYRRTVLANLLRRFWLESQGTAQTDLHALQFEEHTP
jgi:xanthine dehydrogenase small subunit